MKQFLLVVVLLLAVGCPGCHKPEVPAPQAQGTEVEQANPNAPLETEGEVNPPPGCQELRERGGAC